MKKFAAVAAAAALCAALGYLIFSSPRIATLDFRAFYCAATVLREHANPYRTHPLHECENALGDHAFVFYDPGITLPAPVPPYDLAALAGLSLLPFHVAKAVWGALLALAVAAVFVALRRLTKLPLPVITCALLPLIGPSLALGQLVPFYAAALACAALFAHERRPQFAALAASMSLIEPHLGIPVCLSLFIWAPAARLTVAACVAAAATISVAFGGLALNLEYVNTVLPLHALSEISADGQLSFAVIAHALGAAAPLALRIGVLSYAISAGIGILIAGWAARRFGSKAFLVALPAAAAVFGGSYVHATDLIAALPLALLLVIRSEVNRIWPAVALAILIVPWLSPLDSASVMVSWFLLGSGCAAFLLWYLTKNIAPAVVFGACAFACLFGLASAYSSAYHAYILVPHALHITIPLQYPEASWQRAVGERFSTGAAPAWILRAFYWFALALILGLATFRTPRSAVSAS